MATYCTVRDVRLALTPGGVDENQPKGETAAILPDWQILDAIDEAEALINAYVAARYNIVTAEVEEENPENPAETWVNEVAPAPIRSWTRSIAAYLGALTYRRNKDLGEDDPIRLRYNLVMDLLRGVRDHQIGLPLPATDNVGFAPHAENLYEGQLFDLEDFQLGVNDRFIRHQYLWPLYTDGSHG